MLDSGAWGVKVKGIGMMCLCEKYNENCLVIDCIFEAQKIKRQFQELREPNIWIKIEYKYVFYIVPNIQAFVNV